VGLRIYSIDFHYVHVVLIKFKILSSESSHVDNTEKVVPIGFNVEMHILSLINESCIRHRFGASVEFFIDWGLEESNQWRGLVMVPIRERQHYLFIDLGSVWCCRIMDDYRTSEAICGQGISASSRELSKVAYQCIGLPYVNDTNTSLVD